jgi:hypothetical protein
MGWEMVPLVECFDRDLQRLELYVLLVTERAARTSAPAHKFAVLLHRHSPCLAAVRKDDWMGMGVCPREGSANELCTWVRRSKNVK